MELGFAQAYLQATLMVSLLSVWVLVGLFYYLNRYTKREYFTIWTAAWLAYALWITLGLTRPDEGPTSLISMVKQCCVAVSAAFMLWGTLSFLDIPVRQTLFGLFMLFLVAWTVVMPQVATNALQIQLPVFILLGSGSVFAGVCFYRVRRRLPYVGAGMLALGFLLWGLYLAVYPVAQQYPDLHAIGYLVAAVLQLFIAVSMIVLVLEEVRHKTETMVAEIADVRSEKERLQAKVLTGEEQLRRMYDQVRLTEGAQHAYDELRRTQQTVVQQERLRAIGQMACGVAHDINNALSPVCAYTDLLTLTLPDDLPDEARRYLGHIRSAADDVAHIVGRLRQCYRPRSGTEQLEAIAVDRLIAEVAELTRPRWRDDAQRRGVSIEVVCTPTPGLPALLGDPCELREALVNLVFNAVDALPCGGLIELRTSTQAPSAGVDGSQRQVVIEVRDNGLGMDEATRQHCLEPFFTTKAQRSTGLGLSMVYGMMQRHDGLIEIDSAPKRGTTLRLILPVRALPAAPAGKVPAAAAGRSLRILCVDDEPKLRDLLADCLGNYGHRVVVADSGQQGLAMFRSTMEGPEHYEVVITDLGMPEFDGRQVAQGIKAMRPRTPVIMMTGWSDLMKDQGEHSPAVDAVLGKPPKLEDLVATLQLLVP
jgi:signal transduction histidine kinase/CheY-like chemotaxis protein